MAVAVAAAVAVVDGLCTGAGEAVDICVWASWVGLGGGFAVTSSVRSLETSCSRAPILS